MSSLTACPSHTLSFDIFCRAIDNYGDIGVCWRLARQLAHHPHRSRVRLWVDDLERFQRLEPSIQTTVGMQSHSGVHIVHWLAQTPDCIPHDIVIEAFGCRLPDDVISAMKIKNSLWINLEYLSAEPWVSRFHLQPSPQDTGLRKYFFFPGFMHDTGGLLREPNLQERRLAWLSQPKHRDALLRSSGVSTADIELIRQGAQIVFLFCYPDAPVHTLIDTLAQGEQSTLLLIPEGVYPQARSTADQKVRVYHIPFVCQDDFDHLLWSADLNIVRGEDSLVRALWAARPMIWQPYPQQDDAHLIKLDAWLALSPLHMSIQSLIRSWSRGDHDGLKRELIYHQLPHVRDRWAAQHAQWAKSLSEQTDLATALVSFARNTVENG